MMNSLFAGDASTIPGHYSHLAHGPAVGNPSLGFTHVMNQEKIEVVNKFSLLSYLCPKPCFKYSVEPCTPIDSIMVKERNFKLDFRLVSKEDNSLLENTPEGLYLEFKLYSAENPPKQIEFNTCGRGL